MIQMSLRNRILTACAAVAILTSVALFAMASKPKSVIHIITVKWKDDAKPEQIQAALKGVETAATTRPSGRQSRATAGPRRRRRRAMAAATMGAIAAATST